MSYFTANLTREEEEVRAEMDRQNAKWGPQNHPDGTGLPGDAEERDRLRSSCESRFYSGDGTWRDILDEEIAEAYAESDPEKLLIELLQVEAVARQWRMAIHRRLATKAREAAVSGSSS